ncbi:DoxX family protein [Aureibacter tunicatorum]|uniref:Membrane protein YphA (DoxX/SURF4 family) n=1 Tax=Aureibacter tunicatorum TaxID=866807 RepID=A0AAE4BQI8_9BACT|nr:DoxX family protein [Aureibacter tunicatorum]MDR6239169.1 putative membrane protein YphA (DoxX/SURF4 family) [Aureibacter tunicatorum]BDD04905.1 hypothetical protein AUTU_23880 [Aureibacter tunicatorum]
MEKKSHMSSVVRIGLGLIFLIPGFFKLIHPEAFLEYLRTSPVPIPFGDTMFYPITVLEVLGALILIFPLQINKPLRPIFYLMFIGVLTVALISVVIPDALNSFPDQIEMATIFLQQHPERQGVNIDIFPSKIGLINILFHIFAIALLVTLIIEEKASLIGLLKKKIATETP